MRRRALWWARLVAGTRAPVLALVLVLLLVGGVGHTTAAFSARSLNPANTFATGRLGPPAPSSCGSATSSPSSALTARASWSPTASSGWRRGRGSGAW